MIRRPRGRRARFLALAALAGWMLAGPATAEEAPQEKTIEDKLGWHTVKEGESFQTITRHYLGTADLWPENVRLNPQVSDPSLLRAGMRIRVIVERQLPARSATIEEVANDVDKRPRAAPWEDAAPGDELKPRYGVRTRERSSTRLGFDDGSQLTLTELSQVYLKDLETTVTGVKRGSIEINRGQAELLLKAPQPRRLDIEIVVGDSIVRPRPGPAGTGQTRSRRPEGGGAQLMVYGGSSRVEAGGAAVDVPRGMGTSVPEGGTPAPPEKLLPAPATESPARRARFGYANPRFEWRPVAGAVSYLVEVCGDPGCGRLALRATGLTGTSWHPDRLPAGDLFWRVTAVSPSGLDGFPSRAVPFAVTSEVPDLSPPAAAAAVVGSGHATADGAFVLGRGGRIRLEGRDDASGLWEIRYRWKTGETVGAWRLWQERDLAPPDGAAEHTLEVEATDRLGRRAEPWSVRVARDESLPEPPTVRRAQD